MQPQYFALVALFLDSVAAVDFAKGAEKTFLGDQLEKREKNSTVIPAPISVEPSQYWDGNDGPWSSFTLQVGSPKQNVRTMISTAGYQVWTINEESGCPNGTMVGCEDSRGTPFLTNESLSWVPNSMWSLGLEDNLGLDSTAYFGFDTVTLGWQGSGLPTADHVVISNLAADQFWLGTFGLNPQPTNFSNFNDPQQSFLTKLKNNNTIPSLAWAYTAGNQYRFSGNEYGSLVLGGYDQSKFQSTNVTVPFGSDVSRDLLIGVQSITTSSSTTALTSSSGGFYAFIDSTVSQLWLPLSVCEAFETAFGITWDEDKEYYLVNETLHTQLVNQNASVSFTLGESSSGGETVEITLPYAAFDLKIAYPIEFNSTYYFPLKRAANDTQYTLGRTFLQEAYLIADYERRNFTVAPCAWVQNAEADIHTILSPDTVLPSASEASSGVGAGAIAGIVVGAIALIAALLAALWFMRRKRQSHEKRIAELEAKNAAGEASDDNTNSYEDTSRKPFISNPIGGELGSDTEIHEMQVPFKTNAAEIDSSQVNQWGEHQDYYGGKGIGGGVGTMLSVNGTSGGTGTWQSGLSEVEGNNEQIYEMMGSEVQELPASRHMPASRRPSWTNGDEKRLNTTR